MNRSTVLFHEESRPSRFLTWPVVFFAALVVAAGLGSLRGVQPDVIIFVVLGAVLCVLLLLEFVALVIEVRESEVRFSFAPFYRRKIMTANIQRWVIKTYRFQPASSSIRYSWRPPKHCVEIEMKDGSFVTLISEHPEKLSRAIWEAKALAAGEVPPLSIGRTPTVTE
jgi:hypothetical protein